jgi:HPr kinase/phosphorylase
MARRPKISAPDPGTGAAETSGETLTEGTCVALEGSGVLLRGASGSGKSDLALRLIDAGARLVADDVTRIVRAGSALMAHPGPREVGRLEVRGLGIVDVPHTASAPLVLIADLADSAAAVPRLPEPDAAGLLGRPVPRIVLYALEASAAAKLRLAVARLRRDIKG